jgi:N-acetyl-anhydromuramoyl-L-alanine amidase
MDAARKPMTAHRESGSSRRLAIDERGYASIARQIPSPNCDARPPGTFITLVIIHGISLPPGEFGGDAVARLFTNRLDPMAHPYFASIAHLHVSAHFLVRRDGRLVQFVSCNERAWHAGVSRFRGRTHCNDFSIGVEVEGTDDIPYETAQYTMLARLLRALDRRYPIRHVAGHSDVAPDRKTDPGPAFDWPRLRRLTAPRR